MAVKETVVGNKTDGRETVNKAPNEKKKKSKTYYYYFVDIIATFLLPMHFYSIYLRTLILSPLCVDEYTDITFLFLVKNSELLVGK